MAYYKRRRRGGGKSKSGGLKRLVKALCRKVGIRVSRAR